MATKMGLQFPFLWFICPQKWKRSEMSSIKEDRNTTRLEYKVSNGLYNCVLMHFGNVSILIESQAALWDYYIMWEWTTWKKTKVHMHYITDNKIKHSIVYESSMRSGKTHLVHTASVLWLYYFLITHTQ